jgi:hypothetical protein
MRQKYVEFNVFFFVFLKLDCGWHCKGRRSEFCLSLFQWITPICAHRPLHHTNLCPQATSLHQSVPPGHFIHTCYFKIHPKILPPFQNISQGKLRSSEEHVHNNDDDKSCALLGCYAGSNSTSVPGFLFGYFNLIDGSIDRLESSVIRNYLYSLRSNPEELLSLLAPVEA